MRSRSHVSGLGVRLRRASLLIPQLEPGGMVVSNTRVISDACPTSFISGRAFAGSAVRRANRSAVPEHHTCCRPASVHARFQQSDRIPRERSTRPSAVGWEPLTIVTAHLGGSYDPLPDSALGCAADGLGVVAGDLPQEGSEGDIIFAGSRPVLGADQRNRHSADLESAGRRFPCPK